MAAIFSISIIRELRGAPITVLLAIMLLEHDKQVPITAQLLRDVTGYGEHTITDALRTLEYPTRQLISRITGGWKLSTGWQDPLWITQGEIRDIRGFEPTTTTTLIGGQQDVLVKVAEEEGEIRDIRGFSPDQMTIYRVLGDALVGEPVRSRLATSLSDPIYVLGHCLKAAYENTETGLLIHRLRSHDQVDERYRRKAQEKMSRYE